MTKYTYLFLTLLVAAVPRAMAGEEHMPMHPGGAYREVGIGAVAAPIRRATSEDAPPPSRRPERPLHTNKVTLKLPANHFQGESRLRIVDVNDDNPDGILDFDLEGAPLLDNNLDIPGLVSPEVLAMDKYNRMEADGPRRPESSPKPFLNDTAPQQQIAVPPLEETPRASLTAIGPSSFPDPDSQPPSQRIVIKPGLTHDDATLPQPMEAAASGIPAVTVKPGPILSSRQEMRDIEEMERSLKPPSDSPQSLRPPENMASLRPAETTAAPSAAMPPVPSANEYHTMDQRPMAAAIFPPREQAPARNETIMAYEARTMPEQAPVTIRREQTLHVASPETVRTTAASTYGKPVASPPQNIAHARPAPAEPDMVPDLRMGGRPAVMAYEAPGAEPPRERERVARNPLPQRQQVSKAPDRPAPGARKAPERTIASGQETAPGAKRSKRRVATRKPRQAAEIHQATIGGSKAEDWPSSVPGAGATRKTRFKPGAGRFDPNSMHDNQEPEPMRELQSVLDPIYRQNDGQ